MSKAREQVTENAAPVCCGAQRTNQPPSIPPEAKFLPGTGQGSGFLSVLFRRAAFTQSYVRRESLKSQPAPLKSDSQI